MLIAQNTVQGAVSQATIWLEQGVSLLTEFAPKVLGVVVIFFLGRFISGKVANLVKKLMTKGKFDAVLTNFAANGARYLILVFAGLAALEMFGIQTTSFVAVLGAAGFAVGLALQGTLSNFAAGVMLLIFRPFKIGDVVSVAGATGAVDGLDLFSTALMTPNGIRITVPNASVWGATIENYTTLPKRRVDVTVGVAYDADIDTAKRVLIEALDQIEGTNDNDAYLIELGASSIDFELRCHADADDYFRVRQDMLRAAKYALDAAGIGIPYQTLDVNIVSQG